MASEPNTTRRALVAAAFVLPVAGVPAFTHAALRRELAASIEAAIALLDELGGDPDLEPTLAHPQAVWGGHRAGGRYSGGLWAQLGVTDEREEGCEGEGEACEDEGAQEGWFGYDRAYVDAADAEFTRLTGRPSRTILDATGYVMSSPWAGPRSIPLN